MRRVANRRTQRGLAARSRTFLRAARPAPRGSRDCYIPTEADRALVKRLFPDVADPGNPPWRQIAARLIVAGQDQDKLVTYNAPTLLLLLAKLEGMNVTTAGGDSMALARKRGRPAANTDAKEDERIYNAWKTGCYRTYGELAPELGKHKRDVELAIDRHEKRLKRRGTK